MIIKKTKIVCTMGPTTREVAIVRQLLESGMNVARFNFSHGTHEYHKKTLEIVRQASKETGIPVALLLDTKGPEIRTGHIKDGLTIRLIKDDAITLTTEEVEGTKELLSISYKNLPYEVSGGKHIYIADGIIDLEVESVEGCLIHCRVRNGGEIGSRKNVNVIGVKTSLPAVTDKDKKDIVFGIENDFDFIAASFIRKPDDVLEIKRILDDRKSNIKIISKIEDEEGLENIDEIIRVSSGIMVARGDLGVQLPTEQIPLAQKRIITKCNKQNKPVITATQMLDSMIHNPRPTRAELTDVANAIFDGTDAVMLSGETANGKYPVKTVQTMQSICLTVEQSEDYKKKSKSYLNFHELSNDIPNAITKAAYLVATDIRAAAIIAPTRSGNTARNISKYRPTQRIIAVTTSEQVQRQLLLYWGVFPIISELVNDSDKMLNNALKEALDRQLVKNSERVVMLAGVPIHSPIMLNLIKVHVVCTVLGKGEKGFGKITTGSIVKAGDLAEAVMNIKGEGDEILLTKTLDPSFKPVIQKVKGIILEGFSTISFEEIKALNPELVLISQVPNAMNDFEDNFIVSVDGKEKVIYEGVVESST